jgi:all-trans-8'-apo-beta-carotenal 15,15'-oxygenase
MRITIHYNTEFKMQTVSFQSDIPADTPYQVQEWCKGYRSLTEEFDYWIDEVEGQIPTDLRGTLFRNGPGLLDRNGQSVRHPFDGDGMVCAIAFANGKAHFRNRFVQTAGFIAEQQAQKFLYRGVFGTQKPGGWLTNLFDTRLKNIANTQVIYWGGKLLALWEAAEPYRLDPNTLQTIGIDDLNGVLQPGSAFAAHPWIDPGCPELGRSPRLVNFAIKPGLSTAITLYEFALDGVLVQQQTRTVPGFAFMHDFAITPNHCLFLQNPVSFNPLPYLLGLRGAGECLTLQKNQSTQILVIPRDGSAPMKMLSVEAGFVFHHANAFEQEGELYLDSIAYADFPTVDPDQDYREVKFEALAPGQLWRFRLDLATGTVQRRLLESRCCEFPTCHPGKVGRPYRYLYLGAAHEPSGNAPLQAITKLDLASCDRQLWSAAPSGFVGEPVFIPRHPSAYANHLPTTAYSGDEDDGWLLTLVFDAQSDRTDVVILDARDLNQGAVARLHLKHHIPYGLHGTFTPEYFLP